MVLLNDIIPKQYSGLSASPDKVQLVPGDLLSKASEFHLSGSLSEAYHYYHLIPKYSTHKFIAFGNLASIEFSRCNYSKCLQLLMLSHQQASPNYGSFLISNLCFRLGYYREALDFFEYRWLNSFIPSINQYLPVSDVCNSSELSDTLLVQDGGLGDLVFASRLKKIFNSDFPIFFLGDSKSCDLIHLLEPQIHTIVDVNLSLSSSLFKTWIPIQSFMRVANYFLDDSLKNYNPVFIQHFFESNDILDIGLFWQGNQVTELFMIPGSRSIPLFSFSPLFYYNNLRLHSLQVGPGINQIDENPDLKFFHCIHHFPDIAYNFDALAKYILKLDAVITTDSFIANFAGWLGVKSMVIVSKYCDWRWVKRTLSGHSYWYPSIRVFQWDSHLSSVDLNIAIQSFLFDL